MKFYAEPVLWTISGGVAQPIDVIAEPIAWILRGLDDGGAYGDPIVAVANLTISQKRVADVRGIFATRLFDMEMSDGIRAKCHELGALVVEGMGNEPRGILAGTMTVGQDYVADVRAVLTRRSYDAEMSSAIKAVCGEAGASRVRMVRFKKGMRLPPVLLNVKP